MFQGSTILGYVFWMVMGALQVLVIMGIVDLLRSAGKKVVWWKVGILYFSFATLCGTIAGGTTLMGEYESIAGWYFIGVLGIPVAIGMAIVARLFVLQKKSD
ncbi:MAG: hypothetical protein R3Y11_00805 [Pseudomonadota bacterium]